jgi:hypothetical protein
MIALSPLLSWLVVLVVLFIAVVVFAAVVAGGRADEWADGLWHARMAPVDRFRPELDAPVIHIFGGIYDHETHGDFDHDPIRDHDRCEGCNALLRRAFNRLADYDLGPRDADTLMAAIRRELDS